MLNAGSVFTTLGGRFNPAAFQQFDAANKQAAATMSASEAKMTASQARTAASAKRTARVVSAAAAERAAATKRAAAATTAAANQQVVADQRKAGSARRAAGAQVAAARATAGAWAMVDRAQLSLAGSTRLVRDANERTRRMLTATGRAARLGALGVIGFAVAAGVKGVRGAADLEQQLHVLQATAEATDRQMEAVRARAVELGNDLDLPATSAADAAEAMLELVKGGLSVAEAMDAAKGVLQMSAAAQVSNAKAAEYTVDALLAFGLRGREAIRVADLLAAAANATSVEVPQMAQALQQSATVASQLNIPIETTIAMLSQLANAGIKGSDAGTSLKTMLMSLAPVSNRAAEAMEDLGVSAFTAEGALKPVPQVIDEYARALRGLSQEERATALRRIFGTDAIRAANVILARGVETHRRMAAAVEREGAARDMAAARMRGWKGAQEALNNAWETGTTIIGQALLPKLTELGNRAAEAMSRFIDRGGAAQIGEHLADGLDVAVDVLGRLARAGVDVARVLADIGDALQLDDADVLISLAAAIAGFRVAKWVVPGVISLAAAVNSLVLNARTAPSIGMFLSGLNANPIMAAATAVGMLAGGLAFLALKQRSAADLARDVAAAFEEQAAAARALDDAILAAADAQFAAQHADRAHREAKEQTAAALRRYGRDSRKYREALAAEREAGFRAVAAHKRVADERRRILEEERRTRQAANKTLEEAARLRDKRLRDAAAETVAAARWGAAERARAELQRKAIAAWREYDATVQRVARGTARAAISSIQLHRVMEGQRLITDRNVVAISRLARVYDSLPRRTQTQLATTAEPALAQIGTLVGALRDVPRRQVVTILTRATGARAQILALSAVLKGIPSRRVIEVLARAGNARTQLLAMRALIAGVPPRKVLRILETGGPRVQATLRRLIATRLPPKTQMVRGDNRDALAKVAQANSQVLRDLAQQIIRTIVNPAGLFARLAPVYQAVIRTVTALGGRRAAGRPAGASEQAIVGEGSRWQGAREAVIDRRTATGYIVDRPTVVALGADDYVVPLDEYPSRAVGLLRMLADDLGVERFARGRRPRRRAQRRKGAKGRRAPRRRWPVPARIAEGGVPFGDVERRWEAARDDYQRAVAQVRRNRRAVNAARHALARARDALRGAERTGSESARDSARDRVREAERRLAAARRDLERSRRTMASRRPIMERQRAYYRAAKRTDTRAKNLQSDINLARDAMEDADRIDDRDRWEAARRTRTRKLRELIALLQRALGLAAPDTDHWRTLREQLSALGGEAAVQGHSPHTNAEAFGGELGQVTDEEMRVDEPEETPEQREQREHAERIADTGMTDDERRLWEDIRARIALARLTEGLGDDTAAQQEEVSFLERILAAVQQDPARGGSPVIADIAESLHSARENLRSLTGGRGSNSDADLQAQIDQANERARVAEERARISEGALAVFRGPGDIGVGAGNAAAAATAPNITINTLHPADPATLSAIGSAATAGIGLQGLRQSPRQRVGV